VKSNVTRCEVQCHKVWSPVSQDVKSSVTRCEVQCHKVWSPMSRYEVQCHKVWSPVSQSVMSSVTRSEVQYHKVWSPVPLVPWSCECLPSVHESLLWWAISPVMNGLQPLVSTRVSLTLWWNQTLLKPSQGCQPGAEQGCDNVRCKEICTSGMCHMSFVICHTVMYVICHMSYGRLGCSIR